MKKITKLVPIVCAFCLVLGLAGCGKLQIEREVATVNGRVLTKAEFLYYLENVKQQMLAESGAEDAESFWDAEIDGVKASELAKTKALEDMLRTEIACIKAVEEGVPNISDSLAQINSMIQGGESQAQIAEIKRITGLTDEGLAAMLEKVSIAGNYSSSVRMTNAEALTPADEEIRAAYEQEYVRVKHILISNTPQEATDATNTAATTDPVDESEFLAQQEKLANEVMLRAQDGEDFDNLVSLYNEDPGMEQSPEGYTFTKGEMVAAFQNASYELEVGEVSGLVGTPYGWHIIKRYELPTHGDSYLAAIDNLKSSLSETKYNALIDSYKSDMDIQIRQSVIDAIKVK